jgi:hypothetical protein
MREREGERERGREGEREREYERMYKSRRVGEMVKLREKRSECSKYT